MGQYLILTYAVPLLVEGESGDSGNVTRTSLYSITHPTSALLSPKKKSCVMYWYKLFPSYQRGKRYSYNGSSPLNQIEGLQGCSVSLLAIYNCQSFTFIHERSRDLCIVIISFSYDSMSRSSKWKKPSDFWNLRFDFFQWCFLKCLVWNCHFKWNIERYQLQIGEVFPFSWRMKYIYDAYSLSKNST